MAIELIIKRKAFPEREKLELMNLYDNLSDVDKQKALDAYVELAGKYYPAAKYPSFAQRLATLTTQSFKGI